MECFTIDKITFWLIILLITGGISNSNAQKLPKVQMTSLRAPSNIKIDGKTTEWDDQFQAYNKNNRIYYTISNDDENLYFVMQTSDDYANEKATFGITFKIKSDKQGSKRKEDVTIRFPVETNAQKHDPIRMPIDFIGRLKKDTGNAFVKERKIDSLKWIVNKRISTTFKEIGVTGISGIEDRTISIYNTFGIKVASELNAHSLYTYELAIPLKFLNISVSSEQTVKYIILMNGPPNNGPNAPPTIMDDNGQQNIGSPDIAFVMSATDLSGDYKLKKK